MKISVISVSTEVEGVVLGRVSYMWKTKYRTEELWFILYCLFLKSCYQNKKIVKHITLRKWKYIESSYYSWENRALDILFYFFLPEKVNLHMVLSFALLVHSRLLCTLIKHFGYRREYVLKHYLESQKLSPVKAVKKDEWNIWVS